MISRLFYLYLFLLPLQTVYFLREPFVGGVKWEYGVIGLYGIDILLLVLVVWFLMDVFFFKKYQIPNTKYQIPDLILSLFLLWAGLSILWAGDKELALYFFVKLLLAGGLFSIVRYWSGLDFKKVVFVLFAAAVLQSGIGIVQFLAQQSIDSSILGMSAHEASQAGSSVLKIDSGPASPNSGGRFLRAYGTFPHPNVLGGFLGVILILCILYYAFYPSSILSLLPPLTLEDSGAPLRQGSWGEGMILAGLIMILLGLILTFSRAAWLGVMIGVAMLSISVFIQKEGEIRKRFLKMIVAIGMASIVFGTILHEEIFPRFDPATIEREGSVSERIISLRDAERLIGEGNVLLGVGAGNFTAAIIKNGEMGAMGERGDEKVKNEEGERGMKREMGLRPVWSIQPAHNVFILIFSELGIVGLVLFFVFLWSALSQSIPPLNLPLGKGERRIGTIFCIALIVILPSLFLDHWLWTSHFGLLFFFLILGLISRR